MVSDRELIDGLKEGSSECFSETYERYWEGMYRVANNILRDSALAEDVVQEVFVSLWTKKEQLAVHNLKAYLYQSVRYSVFKVIRDGKANSHFYSRLQDITTELVVNEPWLFKEQEDFLNRMLTNMPEKSREVFQLSRQENMTYKQIAQRLNVSEKTVEKRMSCALRFFKAHLSTNLCLILLFGSSLS